MMALGANPCQGDQRTKQLEKKEENA